MEQYLTFLAAHPVLSSIWVALAVLLIITTLKAQFSSIKAISPQQMTMLVNRENGVVVDIRGDSEFARGHIVDSQRLPLEKINKADFSSLEKFKKQPIIVVCNAGISASGAANKLQKAGFEHVSILKGGMNAWVGAGLPTVK